MSEQKKVHIDQNQGFKIKSGLPDSDGNIIGYSLNTDEGIGFCFYKDGTHNLVSTKTSLEVVGHDIADDVSPGKVIVAKNGNIHLEAENGDIVLKARNIRIVAEDGSGEITLNSGKHFYANAPVCTIAGTNTKVAGSMSVETIGTSVESTSQTPNTSTSAVDIQQTSFLGQLTNGLKSLKKFLEQCF